MFGAVVAIKLLPPTECVSLSNSLKIQLSHCTALATRVVRDGLFVGSFSRNQRRGEGNRLGVARFGRLTIQGHSRGVWSSLNNELPRFTGVASAPAVSNWTGVVNLTVLDAECSAASLDMMNENLEVAFVNGTIGGPSWKGIHQPEPAVPSP